MKPRELYLVGNIGTDGNLRLDMSRIKAFISDFKGARVVATFRILEKECTPSIKTFYLNFVVPQVRAAMYENGERYTDEKVDEMLRSMSPVCNNCIPNAETGKYDVSVRELNELSNAELVEHIEFVRLFAAENFYIDIGDIR